MKKFRSKRLHALAVSVMLGVIGGVPAAAKTNSIETDEWQMKLRAYLWLPAIAGETRYDYPEEGGNVEIPVDRILDALEFAFMGGAEFRRGRWTLLTDVIYLDFQASKQGAITLPPGIGPGVNVRLDSGLTGWSWSLGGGYTVWYTDRSNIDLIGGARLLDVDLENDLTVTAPIIGGPLPASFDKGISLWDAVVGVRGRFGINDRWFVPFHIDAGTGDSELTSIGYAGIGRSFGWGSVDLGYRYMFYDQGSDKTLQEVTFHGFVLGFGFRF